jgi:colanic acid/amylovoran biosynthesis glycosyltransferase
MKKIKVANFVKKYAGYKTFIYDEIRSLKKFEPIVLTEMVGSFAYQTPELQIFVREKIPRLKIIEKKSFFGKVLRQNEVKLIRAFMADSGMRMLGLSKKLNLPLITSFHGLDVSERPRNPFYRKKLKRLFIEGDLFLVCSRSMKEDVVHLGCAEDKILVLYGGIDINKFKFCKNKKKNENTVRILMCGRFVEKKGFPYGIRAFYNLLPMHDNLELRIIGGGILEKKIKSLVRGLNIQDKVTFLGPKAPDDIPEEMGNSDIFLSPNITSRRGDKECITHTIKEAMATGLPVVSTFHAGIPELVINNETGFLVEEKDIDALTEKLNCLIEHPELREKMGKRGRKVIEEKFNLEKQITELEKIYTKVLE